MIPLPAAPGDVLAVSTGTGWAARLIRLGEALGGKPSPANHVVIVTHQDAKGRWIGLEGRPGGVGLCDCTPYLSDPRTRSNHAQPRLVQHGQLAFFLGSAAESVGVTYDWCGIAEDVALDLHVADLSSWLDKIYAWPSDDGKLPGAMVCSSLAAALYDQPEVDWKHPDLGTERVCQPSSWWIFNDKQQWNN
jgi:hypothetical protein